MRNWLPPGSEARHKLPPIQWSHSELDNIKNNTENYALLKQNPLKSVILKRFPLSTIYSNPIKIFQKFWSHLKILGTKKETWNKIHAAGPQLCNDLLTLLLSVTECLLRVNWYKFWMWGETQNFVTWATRHAEFVQPCHITTRKTQTHIQSTKTYLQSRYNVSSVLYKLIQISHFASLLELIIQIQFQMTKLISYGHIWSFT